MSVANPYLHGKQPGNAAETRLKKRAVTASVAVASTLIIIKLAAFFATNSVSLLSSMMDSGFDLLASIIIMISVTHAATPADADHRFGHGKIEALGALAQGVFILGSATFLFAESCRRILAPETVQAPVAGIAVMLVSITLTFVLILYQRRIIHATGSTAVSADRIHYVGDILMNAGVILSLALGYFIPWPYFDPIFALAISLRLIYSAWQISRHSFDILLDREIDGPDREKLMSIVTAHPAVQGVHDLRTRNTGERYFLSFHAEMDPGMTIAEVHDAMDDIERLIFNAFPKSEVLIHPEPAGLKDHRIDDIIAGHQGELFAKT